MWTRLMQDGGKHQWTRSRPGGPKKDRAQTQERDSAVLHDKLFRDFQGKICVADAFPSLPWLCLPCLPCGNAHDQYEEQTSPTHAARVASYGSCLAAMAEQLWGLLRQAAVLLRRRPSAFLLTHPCRGTRSLHLTTTDPFAVTMPLISALVLWAPLEAYRNLQPPSTNCP